MTTNRTITWTDVGPIKNYSIDVPPEGGLVVFEGPNGAGKTHLLEALDDALMKDRKTDLPVRDHAPRAEVDVFGEIVLRRSRRLSRLGKLEASTLEGKFSIADLIEPGYDDPAASDARRIKALIQLKQGILADPSMFYHLVGGQERFDQLVPADSVEGVDLVLMAAKIKAGLEKASRDLAATAKANNNLATASRLSVGDTDLNGESDELVLRAEHTKAILEVSRLTEGSKAYETAVAKHETAKRQLETIRTRYTGGSAQALRVQLDTLTTELTELQTSLLLKQTAVKIAKKALDDAEIYSDTYDALEDIIKAQLPDPVLEETLDAAQNLASTASQALENGALIRKAAYDLENASKLKSAANSQTLEAERLRDAAKSTDSVLASVVSSLGVPLSVEGGRLIVTNSDRNAEGKELFEDLSKGEKCALVISIAIGAVGTGGIFTIPQHFFEGLTPSIQQDIALQLENSGVIAVTAKAVDADEITAKVVDPHPIV